VKGEAENLASQSQYLKALQVAITAPTHAKEQTVKDLAAYTVANILNAIKDADSQKTIDALSEDERAKLLGFVYKGMATGLNCNTLLKWHGLLVDKDGTGLIMRVLVDRK